MSQVRSVTYVSGLDNVGFGVRRRDFNPRPSEFEIRCSIQLSYERIPDFNGLHRNGGPKHSAAPE